MKGCVALQHTVSDCFKFRSRKLKAGKARSIPVLSTSKVPDSAVASFLVGLSLDHRLTNNDSETYY